MNNINVFYKDYLKKPLSEIIEDMHKFNAGCSSLKLRDEKDEVIAGVFVVKGDLANEIANKIDFICEDKK